MSVLIIAGGLLAFIPSFLWCYTKYTSERPHVYTKYGSDLYERVHQHINLLQDIYQPTWWCPFGSPMTIARHMFRTPIFLPFKREIVVFPDGGEAGIDWLANDDIQDNAPIIAFLPGITGSTHDSAYIHYPARDAAARGWRVVVVNARGHAGVALKTKRTYNAAIKTDIEFIIKKINDRYLEAKKVGCGFSMGGMILWNYLATKTKEDVGLDGAMIISSPFDPASCNDSIERFLPRITFNRQIAKNMIRLMSPYRELFEDKCDIEKVVACRTIRELDTHFIAPVFGYKSCEEYYVDAALYTKVKKIPIPTVCLNSHDDCFSPTHSIPLDDILESENVVSIITRHGGHTAFARDGEEAGVQGHGLVEDLVEQWGNLIVAMN